MKISDCLRLGLGRLAPGAWRIVSIHLEPEEGEIVQSAAGRIEKIVRIPWAGKPVSERARLLRVRREEERIAGDSIVCTYPHRRAIVKTLVLPATEPREILEMVRLQALRQMPLSAEEITVNCHLLDRPSEGHSRLLMIVTRKEEVRRHLETLHEAGLSPDRLVLDSLIALPLLRGHDQPEEQALAIDLEEGVMTLGLFQGAALQCARSLFLPQKSAEWLAVFQGEVEKTILSTNASLSALRVDLAGKEKMRAAADKILREKWGLRVRRVDPSQRTTFAGNPPPSWPALGASLPSAFSTPNLLPEEELRRKNLRDARVGSLTTLLFSCVFVILAGAGLAERFHNKQKYLSRLTLEEKEIASKTAELRRMRLQTRMIRNQMAEKGSFLNVMADLNRAAPGRISIQNITFERDRMLRIEGTSFSLSEALRSIGELQKNPLFSGMELSSSNSRRAQERELIDFQFSCPLDLHQPPREGRRKRFVNVESGINYLLPTGGEGGDEGANYEKIQ
jgi:hypothetical protein